MEELDPVFLKLEVAAVAAVVTLDDGAQAVSLARALLDGGVRAIELTLRSDAALRGLEAIAREVPDMLLGAGTVLGASQVQAVLDCGAAFGVAPGTNPDVVRAAAAGGLPFAPGVATPSDIEAALALGCRVLKFFPAEGMGGLPYLQSIAAPYRHLGLRYIPLGGVNGSNLADYLGCPDVLAVGGSWLVPKPMVEAGNWKAIGELAANAVRIAKEAKGK